MYKDVFISYAKEDIKIAEQLYDQLSKRGFSPWLDKKKLRGGDDWDYKINKALRESTFVILLLSSISVAKRGYIQKEFRRAIEYAESKLPDDIFLIPVLLDSCEVPDSLKKIQWVELKSEHSFDSILDSLNHQRNRYIDSMSPSDIEIQDYSIVALDPKVDVANGLGYRCEVPQFRQNRFFDHDFVNTFIRQTTLLAISDARRVVMLDPHFKHQVREFPYYLDISHSIQRLDTHALSMAIYCDSFFGGVHPNAVGYTINIAFSPERVLRIYDIVEQHDLHQFLLESLSRFGNEDQKEHLANYISNVTYDNVLFTFTDGFIEVNFMNQIPRVILALGTLTIPIPEIRTRDWKTR